MGPTVPRSVDLTLKQAEEHIEGGYPGLIGRHGGRQSNSVTMNSTWRDH
jgi:hypothetical protein